jgi:regulator of protease activity HflC (stomatin/prohibitin superfamily)
MADIRTYPFYRHVRSEPSAYLLHYRKGTLRRHGRGLAFWFQPLSAAIAEVPVDDREQPIILRGRTGDFQELIVQGTISYRVNDPVTLASRIDFSLDLRTGRYLREPLEQLAGLVTQLAQQFALNVIAKTPLVTVLKDGVERIQAQIWEGLRDSSELRGMGIEVVAVRISDLSATSEMAKALEAPTRESIQQEADEATFARRAAAVEKERTIAENELQNKIELAKREETLIRQQGQNEKQKAVEAVEADLVRADGQAKRLKLAAEAEAERISVVEASRNTTEKQRVGIYRELEANALLALAAHRLAENPPPVEHLYITPEMLGPALQNLIKSAAAPGNEKE